MKLRYPDYISVYHNKACDDFKFQPEIENELYQIQSDISDNKLTIYLRADAEPMKYIRLFWHFTEEEKRTDGIKVLGDEWERTYGTTSWQGIMPSRCMPWVCSVSNGSDADMNYKGRFTECFGVGVNPNAMCFWQYDTGGLTLWLDVRCGGEGVVLSGRRLEVCSILFGEYRDSSAFDGICRFYEALSENRIEADHKIYGSNNWYYAYGKSSHEEILRDARILANICKSNSNPPYMVIDDGWQQNLTTGPWVNNPSIFPDMKRLAEEIKALGLRSGIWVRPLADCHKQLAEMKDEHRIQYNKDFLDPSHPAVLDYVRHFISVISKEWGYQLIKHDFSTYDMFGFWGFQRNEVLAAKGWHFYDREKTSAEVVKGLYQAIYEAAGKAVILGCNVIGHLAVGYMHINRIGDDTSGRQWDRTRHMGVNTLAFRLCHKAFYVPDADCVGITEKIDWKLNREWLKIVANSGTALFVSPKPDVLNDEIISDLTKAYAINSIQEDQLKPLDWMENSCPERWLLNGNEMTFHWYPESRKISIDEKVLG